MGDATRPVAPVPFGVAVILSLLGVVLHNWLEFGAAALPALETGTIPVALVQLGFLALWWWLPVARLGSMVALGALALVHLVVGSILTVLPLAMLPFEPEQSLPHYGSHLLYGVLQLPLLWLLARRLAGRRR